MFGETILFSPYCRREGTLTCRATEKRGNVQVLVEFISFQRWTRLFECRTGPPILLRVYGYRILLYHPHSMCRKACTTTTAPFDVYSAPRQDENISRTAYFEWNRVELKSYRVGSRGGWRSFSEFSDDFKELCWRFCWPPIGFQLVFSWSFCLIERNSLILKMRHWGFWAYISKFESFGSDCRFDVQLLDHPERVDLNTTYPPIVQHYYL